MAELDEMISSILKDPQSMQMVSSLLAGLGGDKEHKKDESIENAPALPFDVNKLAPLLTKMNAPPDERCRLLMALRPFVSQERRQRIDQSIQILKMMSLAGEMGGLGLV